MLISRPRSWCLTESPFLVGQKLKRCEYVCILRIGPTEIEDVVMLSGGETSQSSELITFINKKSGRLRGHDVGVYHQADDHIVMSVRNSGGTKRMNQSPKSIDGQR
jgi:hypothetical protein